MLISTVDVKPLASESAFIVFEGVNGAGKSTLIQKVSNYLSEKSLDSLVTREPGGNNQFGENIRKLLLDNPEKIPELSELFLFAADRAYHVNKIIQPGLSSKKIVLSDRYYYSTIAFQGYGRGINLELIEQINQIAIQNCLPDLVILLDLDPEVGLKRNQSQERDSFEEEQLVFHKKTREGFLKIAEELPEKFILIDANQTEEQVWQNCKEIFDQLITL